MASKRARARRRVAAVLASWRSAARCAAMWGWVDQARMSSVESGALMAAERWGGERPWVRRELRRARSEGERGDVGCGMSVAAATAEPDVGAGMGLCESWIGEAGVVGAMNR